MHVRQSKTARVGLGGAHNVHGAPEKRRPGNVTGDWRCTACGVRVFASKAACFKCRAPRPESKSEEATPVPHHVVEPTAPHAASIILLHGFTGSGTELADEVLPALRSRLSCPSLASMRFIFPNAPKRRISCYDRDQQKTTAWHDYFTDHGGDEGRPELEEEINFGHVEWSRQQVHRAIEEEMARLGGDAGRVVLGGKSQGCCIALDAALTCKHTVGGVFASYGQVYASTPVPRSRRGLRVAAFHGASDRCIAASLALRSYARMLDAGYTKTRVHIEPGALPPPAPSPPSAPPRPPPRPPSTHPSFSRSVPTHLAREPLEAPLRP